jgi:hypothetical protein
VYILQFALKKDCLLVTDTYGKEQDCNALHVNVQNQVVAHYMLLVLSKPRVTVANKGN